MKKIKLNKKEKEYLKSKGWTVNDIFKLFGISEKSFYSNEHFIQYLNEKFFNKSYK